MKYSIIRFLAGLTVVSMLSLTACEKDFTNPGAATEDQVLNSADGLIALAVGLQRRWSVSRVSPVYNYVTGSGFSTFELRLINPGNTDENEMSQGKNNISGNNAVVRNLWEQSLLTRAEAQKILDNAAIVPDASVRASLVAYASIFHALANGTLAQFFEQVPLETKQDATFSSAQAALEEAVEVLEKAGTDLSGVTIPTSFLNKTPKSIDIKNTVNALLARFYNQLGQHDKAIAAANAVDLAVKSSFKYDDVNPNPIAFISINTNNVYQPINLSLGLPAALQPDAADKRLTFYFQNTNPAGGDFRAAGFFNGNSVAIPVYLPGEMTLIKAEALARKSMLSEAVTELNKVLTKEPATDAFGVGAGLPAYSGAQTQEAILTEIYRNRCIELFMSGLRLADSKRFNRTAPNESGEERNRNWYPYPNSERDNNPNTPNDPAI